MEFCLHKSLHSRFAYSGTHTVGLLVQGALSVLALFFPRASAKELAGISYKRSIISRLAGRLFHFV